ncbi:unnamed protein product [Meganyctiphanes norvegica]|uniref:Reverse transcriptase n=1 Tax=Meganyctiphanes norvegica TaxID=48144 RepID=A0AAV2QIA3_MEGNR
MRSVLFQRNTEDACSGELCGKLHVENLQFDKWRNQEIINPYRQEKIKMDKSEEIEQDNRNRKNPIENKTENKNDNTNEEIEGLIGANALPTNQEWEDMPIWDDNVYMNQNRKKQKNNEILVNICTFHAIGECRYGKDKCQNIHNDVIREDIIRERSKVRIGQTWSVCVHYIMGKCGYGWDCLQYHPISRIEDIEDNNEEKLADNKENNSNKNNDVDNSKSEDIKVNSNEEKTAEKNEIKNDKLYMSIIKDKIESHLIRNDLVKFNQTGFTKGGRLEYNHFLLQYLVKDNIENKGNKKPLIMTAIDFTKAFDSINRENMMKCLIEYKIHPYIIDTFAKIYQGDHTYIEFKDKKIKIDITNGIRQGCIASSVLFKLITYVIIEKLEKEGISYKIDNININSIFFADDSILVADSVQSAERNLRILIETSEKFGLHINKEKSNVIVYRNAKEKREIKEIAGIKVTNNITYLGLEMNNTINMFRNQKINTSEKARKLANITYSVISRSCNKILIGKTFWKCVVVPSLLHGIEVINYTNTEINKLQIIENSVYRKILGARPNSAKEALRSEIGSSLMSTRIMQSKLFFIKSIIEGDNLLIKEVLRNIRQNPLNRWNIQINEYLKELEITYSELINMSKIEIKNLIRKNDTNKWKRAIKLQKTLVYYEKYKKDITDENIYRNDHSSVLLFQARTNSLPLADEEKYKKRSTTCVMCKSEEENIKHFLFRCKITEVIRHKYLNRINSNEEEYAIKEILFDKENIDRTKDFLSELWKKRKKVINIINKEKEKEEYDMEVKRICQMKNPFQRKGG